MTPALPRIVKHIKFNLGTPVEDDKHLAFIAGLNQMPLVIEMHQAGYARQLTGAWLLGQQDLELSDELPCNRPSQFEDFGDGPLLLGQGG